jgi:hypothetical protein
MTFILYDLARELLWKKYQKNGCSFKRRRRALHKIVVKTNCNVAYFSLMPIINQKNCVPKGKQLPFMKTDILPSRKGNGTELNAPVSHVPHNIRGGKLNS